MKKILLIAVGLMLSVVAGCAALDSATEKAKVIAAHVQTLKTKGCDALPEAAQMDRQQQDLIIKTRIWSPLVLISIQRLQVAQKLGRATSHLCI
ncbi:MAG: hypothetical protein MJK13_12130 [Pseudomonadales bacterium]|nr:hypothetical protein [Pseudomonadales bacterium]